MSLLPPNTTAFEQHVCDVTAKATQLPVRTKTLVHPLTAPVDFLPHLAWQNSVDRWQRTWTENEKRAQIKASFGIHQKKGTISALKRVVESFGYQLQVREWWEENPIAQAGTFSLEIDTRGLSLTEESYNTLITLLNDAKPLTRLLTSIELNILNVRGSTNFQCAAYNGEDTVIFPKQKHPDAPICIGLMHSTADEITIFPKTISTTSSVLFFIRHYITDDTTIYPRVAS